MVDGERLPQERAFNSNTHIQLNNRWWCTRGHHRAARRDYCDRCMRGGPALRVDRYLAPWLGFVADDRYAVSPQLFFNYWSGDGGRRTHSIPTAT